MSWTKLESEDILFNRRRQGKMGSLLGQQLLWEPLNIFIVVFSSQPPKKRKEIQRKIKLFTRESSQQEKEEREIFLGFFF